MRTCESCGQDIRRDATWSNAYYACRRFCNRVCQSKGRPSIDSDYEVVANGCWEWRGHVDRNGYGKAYDADMPKGRRLDWAHRVSYRKRVGEIPAGHDLDHTCENTICINPDHLDPVTKAEHAYRTFSRAGRHAQQAEASRLRQSGMTYADIAAAMGLLGKESAHAKVMSAISNGLVDAADLPTVNRLDDTDREDIRALHALGIPQLDLSAWYRVDGSQISRIVNGMTSGHRKAS